jgi:hypothetical protein
MRRDGRHEPPIVAPESIAWRARVCGDLLGGLDMVLLTNTPGALAAVSGRSLASLRGR